MRTTVHKRPVLFTLLSLFAAMAAADTTPAPTAAPSVAATTASDGLEPVSPPGTTRRGPMLETLGDTRRVREGYTQAAESWAELANREARRKAIGAAPTNRSRGPAVWLADVDTLLFADHDNDGYFRGFSLGLDADTDYGEARLYALISLGRDGWFEPLHTTNTFEVHGEISADEYRVEIELLSSFEAGHYDVRVELFDAWSGYLLDSASWQQYRNLGALPLESAQQDHNTFAHSPFGSGHGPAYDGHVSGQYVAAEYVGASGAGLLGVLAGLALWRVRQRDRTSGRAPL